MGSNGTPSPPQFFTIDDSDLTALKDTIVVITGAASGIGLAATKIALSLGAKIVAGDINDCPITNDNLAFVKVDVCDWQQQSALFKKAIELHGKIDHVFANAGSSAQSPSTPTQDRITNVNPQASDQSTHSAKTS